MGAKDPSVTRPLSHYVTAPLIYGGSFQLLPLVGEVPRGGRGMIVFLLGHVQIEKKR